MANVTAGQFKGNENEATNYLKGLGLGDPSSGVVRYAAHGDTGYSMGDAQRFNLPISARLQQEEQTRIRNEAIRPAVESLEKTKPEIGARYDILGQQSLAREAPLKERYSNLIAQLTSRESKETAQQGKVLSQEYGKRGIPLSSGVYQQDLTGKTQDISQYYGQQQKDVSLAQEDDLMALHNERQNIEQDRIATMRQIDQEIANLKAGAGNQAASDALQMIAVAEQRKFESRFDDVDRRIKEASLKGTSDPYSQYKVLNEGDTLFDLSSLKSIFKSGKTYKAGSGGGEERDF